MAKSEKELRAEIEELVNEFYAVKFAKNEFIPGKSQVRYAGRVFDSAEIKAGSMRPWISGLPRAGSARSSRLSSRTSWAPNTHSS